MYQTPAEHPRIVKLLSCVWISSHTFYCPWESELLQRRGHPDATTNLVHSANIPLMALFTTTQTLGMNHCKTTFGARNDSSINSRSGTELFSIYERLPKQWAEWKAQRDDPQCFPSQRAHDANATLVADSQNRQSAVRHIKVLQVYRYCSDVLQQLLTQLSGD